jgi:hypothetical protein
MYTNAEICVDIVSIHLHARTSMPARTRRAHTDIQAYIHTQIREVLEKARSTTTSQDHIKSACIEAMNMHTHTYVHTYVCICTHTYAYAHTHTQMTDALEKVRSMATSKDGISSACVDAKS